MKAIFITGGASGIGRATARLFARRGWRVGLADVDAAGLAGTAALLAPASADTYVMDVRDRAAWDDALARFVAASGGRLDVLFNNAGIPSGGPFGEIETAEIDRVIAVNLTGVLYGARAAYRHLKTTPGACLLNTASAAAIYGSPGMATYCATKFAVRGLTEALDIEWAPEGIKVRALIPGFIDTPMLDQMLPGSNRTGREGVVEAGLEFTAVERVAEAAWDAVHGRRVHLYVGPTAKRLAFLARWLPGQLRRRLLRSRLAREGLLAD